MGWDRTKDPGLSQTLSFFTQNFQDSQAKHDMQRRQTRSDLMGRLPLKLWGRENAQRAEEKERPLHPATPRFHVLSTCWCPFDRPDRLDVGLGLKVQTYNRAILEKKISSHPGMANQGWHLKKKAVTSAFVSSISLGTSERGVSNNVTN
ncbi:predicted protein [Coccidioides posadasii str. Silveira]|uniref:Predicted protein n=1 Tax=Coccidioides posadasii (strain RMSCC 757 / Silveira) TaxID=443226 RepID=E9DIN2_COCPS|nr:predicted protein [Coccidioides posadasii str. Silveira]